VIAPAASVFGFLVQQDGRRLRDVGMEIDNHWDGTRPEIDQAAVQRIDLLMRSESSDNGRWVHIAKALRSRSLIPALELLVEQNAATMQARGLSAPWLAVESGRISVKYRDEQAYLPDAEELPGWWRNPYFLPTLVSIARQVHAR
jgi:hypothetical protein